MKSRKEHQVDFIMEVFKNKSNNLIHIQDVVDSIEERYQEEFTLFFIDNGVYPKALVYVKDVYAGEIHSISGLPRFYAD